MKRASMMHLALRAFHRVGMLKSIVLVCYSCSCDRWRLLTRQYMLMVNYINGKLLCQLFEKRKNISWGLRWKIHTKGVINLTALGFFCKREYSNANAAPSSTTLYCTTLDHSNVSSSSCKILTFKISSGIKFERNKSHILYSSQSECTTAWIFENWKHDSTTFMKQIHCEPEHLHKQSIRESNLYIATVIASSYSKLGERHCQYNITHLPAVAAAVWKNNPIIAIHYAHHIQILQIWYYRLNFDNSNKFQELIFLLRVR